MTYEQLQNSLPLDKSFTVRRKGTDMNFVLTPKLRRVVDCYRPEPGPGATSEDMKADDWEAIDYVPKP